MHKLAIYDMDRTITILPTYSAFLLYVALRLSPWRLALLPLSALAGMGYLVRLVGRERLKELNQALLLGHAKRNRIAESVAAYARKVVRANIRPGALAQIDADRAEGYRIVIATASYRLYAEAIADELGISDVIATELAEADGRVLPRITGGNCYGANKVRMISAWLDAQGLDRKDCMIKGYSDHVSDRPMLEMADVAIAANPHGALNRLAAARGWTVVQWNR